MWWVTGAVCNAIVAVAYFLIAVSIIRPLVASGQLRSNPLGAATAAIFVTCAVHHGGHTVHMLLPYAGMEQRQGLAMREAFDAQMAVWDVITAAVGVYYWTLRRTYSALMHGAKLFEDLKQREQQALELNDEVLQGIVVAKLALDLGEQERAAAALERAIGSASRIITDLLGPGARSSRPGLLRDAPALGHGTATDREYADPAHADQTPAEQELADQALAEHDLPGQEQPQTPADADQEPSR